MAPGWVGFVVPIGGAVGLICGAEPIHAHVNPMRGSVGSLPMLPPVGFSCAWKG